MEKVLKDIEKKILQELTKVKTESRDFLGKTGYTVSANQIKVIANRFLVPNQEIEVLALREKIIPERYHRNLGVFSPAEQIKLIRSKVTIIGLGGLGGTILELLARVGIGELVVVDKDIIGESNLNRQILSRETNLGEEKIKAALERE